MENLVKLKMVVMPSEISIEAILKVMNCGRGLWGGGRAFLPHMLKKNIAVLTSETYGLPFF